MVASSIELIEQKILGCIYTKNKLVEEVFIKEEYFTNPYNRTVFKVSLEFYQKNKKLDIALIYQEYQKYLTNNFIKFITDITDDILTTTIFDEYQEKLFEIYKNNLILKYVFKFANQEIKQEELFEKLDLIKNMVSNKNIGYLTEEEIRDKLFNENQQIKFRLKSISDSIILRFHDFLIIGARTGVGKTGFALNLLEDISKRFKCLYFNIEMTEQEIYKRIIAINSGVYIRNLTKPETEYQKSLIDKSIKEIANRKIKVFSGLQTTNSIKQTIIRESKKEHVVVFIDYIGLIGGARNQSLYERITTIVKELRNISLAFDCTIIGLAQVNRNGAKNDIPQLHDLKDSGELEQSATGVILLHDPQGISKDSKTELNAIIAKNRHNLPAPVKIEYFKYNQQVFEKGRY